MDRDIFRRKNIRLQPGFDPTASCLSDGRATNWATVKISTYLNGVTKWRFGKNLKKRYTDGNFRPQQSCKGSEEAPGDLNSDNSKNNYVSSSF